MTAGSPVYWADGTEAGRALQDIVFHEPGFERGGHRCLERSIHRSSGDHVGVSLCFRVQDVKAP